MDKRLGPVQELMKDESFVREMFSKEEPEDVQALFEGKGVEFSLDEVKQLGSMLDKISSGEVSAEQLEKAANGELSEAELEDVAGGSVVLSFVAIGVTTAIIGGGSAVGSYELVRNWDTVTDSVGRFFRRW